MENMPSRKTTPIKYSMEEWGRDHWATFAFLAKMCNEFKESGAPFGMFVLAEENNDRYESRSGIRLDDRTLDVRSYDEWNCAEDMMGEELIENMGTFMYPRFFLLPRGIRAYEQLNDWLNNSGTLGNFKYMEECQND